MFVSWREFRKGKSKRADVQAFELKLEDNVFDLYYSLRNKTYRHGGYESFFVSDPKRRHIHKASVRDRLLHHAIVRIIEPLFDSKFIFDSFSCRKNKGTHAAIARFRNKTWQLSRNNTRRIWVLKLDIRQFFKSVDQKILFQMITRTVKDRDVLAILEDIITSFPIGIPLGNLTSQIFANIYLNELDQFVKHQLKPKFYIRYCDDFLLVDKDKSLLLNSLRSIHKFLDEHLHQSLHSNKIIIKPYHSGVDFLGFICFPNFLILRTKTKVRMLKKLSPKNSTSYLGLIQHGRSINLKKTILKLIEKGS